MPGLKLSPKLMIAAGVYLAIAMAGMAISTLSLVEAGSIWCFYLGGLIAILGCIASLTYLVEDIVQAINEAQEARDQRLIANVLHEITKNGNADRGGEKDDTV